MNEPMTNNAPAALYFCDCQTDGTPWSYTGTLTQIIERLSRDSEIPKEEMVEWVLKSRSEVREDRGHMTTEKFHVDGEQWSASIYLITGTHDEDAR